MKMDIRLIAKIGGIWDVNGIPCIALDDDFREMRKEIGVVGVLEREWASQVSWGLSL